MRQKPGNIISAVQFNVAAMDTGKPSILYDGNASDGNPFCFFSSSPNNAVGRSGLGTKNSCLGPAFFCLLCFGALKSLCNHLKKKTKKNRKEKKKGQITFNSFLRDDGSGNGEAQLHNTNRLNQTSRIINKHKPNCSFLTGAKGKEENNLDVIAPFDVIARIVRGEATSGTGGAIVNMQNVATKPYEAAPFHAS